MFSICFSLLFLPYPAYGSIIFYFQNMGKVRTKTVKKAARILVEKYYFKLNNDFHTNKRVCDEVAVIPSIRLRNQIAGYVLLYFCFENWGVLRIHYLLFKIFIVN